MPTSIKLSAFPKCAAKDNPGIRVLAPNVVETTDFDGACALHGKDAPEEWRAPWCGGRSEDLYNNYGGGGRRRFIVYPDGPDDYVELPGQSAPVPVARRKFTVSVNKDGSLSNINDSKNQYSHERGFDAAGAKVVLDILREMRLFSGDDIGDTNWSDIDHAEIWADNGFTPENARYWETMLYEWDWIGTDDERAVTEAIQQIYEWSRTDMDIDECIEWFKSGVEPKDARWQKRKYGLNGATVGRWQSFDGTELPDTGLYAEMTKRNMRPEDLRLARQVRRVLSSIDDKEIAEGTLIAKQLGNSFDLEGLEWVMRDPSRRIKYVQKNNPSAELISALYNLDAGQSPHAFVQTLLAAGLDPELGEWSATNIVALRSELQARKDKLKQASITLHASFDKEALGQITLYHGTVSNFLPSIAAQGLIGDKSRQREKDIFLTADFGTAQWYALHMDPNQGQGKPIILEVSVNRPKDVNQLVQDHTDDTEWTGQSEDSDNDMRLVEQTYRQLGIDVAPMQAYLESLAHGGNLEFPLAGDMLQGLRNNNDLQDKQTQRRQVQQAIQALQPQLRTLTVDQSGNLKRNQEWFTQKLQLRTPVSIQPQQIRAVWVRDDDVYLQDYSIVSQRQSHETHELPGHESDVASNISSLVEAAIGYVERRDQDVEWLIQRLEGAELERFPESQKAMEDMDKALRDFMDMDLTALTPEDEEQLQEIESTLEGIQMEADSGSIGEPAGESHEWLRLRVNDALAALNKAHLYQRPARPNTPSTAKPGESWRKRSSLILHAHAYRASSHASSLAIKTAGLYGPIVPEDRYLTGINLAELGFSEKEWPPLAGPKTEAEFLDNLTRLSPGTATRVGKPELEARILDHLRDGYKNVGDHTQIDRFERAQVAVTAPWNVRSVFNSINAYTKNQRKRDQTLQHLSSMPQETNYFGLCYRGMHLPVEQIEELEPGATINLGNVSSWTENMSIALQFIEHESAQEKARRRELGLETERLPVLFRMTPDRGISIFHLSEFPEEEEVLTSGQARIDAVKYDEKLRLTLVDASPISIAESSTPVKDANENLAKEKAKPGESWLTKRTSSLILHARAYRATHAYSWSSRASSLAKTAKSLLESKGGSEYDENCSRNRKGELERRPSGRGDMPLLRAGSSDSNKDVPASRVRANRSSSASENAEVDSLVASDGSRTRGLRISALARIAVQHIAAQHVAARSWFKNVKITEWKKVLTNLGFKHDGDRGDHEIWRNKTTGKVTDIDFDHAPYMDPNLFTRDIPMQVGVSERELARLLGKDAGKELESSTPALDAPTAQDQILTLSKEDFLAASIAGYVFGQTTRDVVARNAEGNTVLSDAFFSLPADARARALSRIQQKAIKTAYLRPGKTPGDKAVVVIRIPEEIASQFPVELEAENGPPHLTLAYITGPFSEEDRARLLEIVQDVASSHKRFQVALSPGVEWFTSDNEKSRAEGRAEIAHKGVEEKTFEAMNEVHLDLMDALENAGFKPIRRDEFKAHATLAYSPNREYNGSSPEGTFMADELTLWGWEEDMEAPLSSTGQALLMSASVLAR